MDMGRGSKFKDGIRIAAGAYLIYLGLRVFREGVLEHGLTGGGYVVGIIAGIGFVVFGAGVIVYSLKSLARAAKEESEAEEAARLEAEENEKTGLADGTAAGADTPANRESAEIGAETGGQPAADSATVSGGQQTGAGRVSGSIFDKAMGNLTVAAEDPSDGEADVPGSAAGTASEESGDAFSDAAEGPDESGEDIGVQK